MTQPVSVRLHSKHKELMTSCVSSAASVTLKSAELRKPHILSHSSSTGLDEIFRGL